MKTNHTLHRRSSGLIAALMLMLALGNASAAADSPLLADSLTGSQFEYAVKRGDSIASVAARFGQGAGVLARDNGLKPDARLKPGEKLRVDNRHIVAQNLPQGILINIPQRMLFYFENSQLIAAYPVALGRPDWPTPAGEFKVRSLERDKPWIVPVSIQEEMRREGKPVLTRVPPGAENPLGRHWIGLSLPGYGIHGTIAPTSIYGLRSHGCIRLHPEDVADLFDRLATGDPGRLIYTPVLLARLPDGRLWLEVHRDAYKKGVDPLASVRALAFAEKLDDLIDWDKAVAVIREQAGLAREIGLTPALQNKEK